jgi:Mitochondrial carrier protein
MRIQRDRSGLLLLGIATTLLAIFGGCGAVHADGAHASVVRHYSWRRPALTRRRQSETVGRISANEMDKLLGSARCEEGENAPYYLQSTQLCSSPAAAAPVTQSLLKTLVRGAVLRVASDLSGGTAFESVKTRVATTREGPIESFRSIVGNGGYGALWTGTSSRMIEGALVGGCFMVGSRLTKTRLTALRASAPVAALCGGLVGGIAQAVIMTPAGLIFTTLNCQKGKPGADIDAAAVVRRVVREHGPTGLFAGFVPMALRQASNWASRAGFTEIARTSFQLSSFGMPGELASGTIGGLISCWNTPIETARVLTQRDLSSGQPTKSMMGYWKDIIQEDGYVGCFRGVTPRALQAVWQTVFLVVVPNILGI